MDNMRTSLSLVDDDGLDESMSPPSATAATSSTAAAGPGGGGKAPVVRSAR